MMKKIISFFTALSMTLMLFTGMPISISAAADIAIDETNFPDENFRNYISDNFDTDIDGSLSASEIANVTKIDVDGKNIADLTGIGYFTALTILYCNNNKLTSIDLSQNTKLEKLELMSNQLTSIDLSQNIKLKVLVLSYNQLTSIDLSDLSGKTTLSTTNITGNKYAVPGCMIDLADLPKILPTGFELDKVSRWTQGKLVDNNEKILCLGKSKVASYSYESGYETYEAMFSLVFSGHSCTKTEAKDATCTEDGNIEYWSCSGCGYKFKKEIPTAEADIIFNDKDVVTTATGHKYQDEWTSDDNKHWHKCADCHDQKDVSDHDWETPPTEEADGKKTYTCKVCSATKTESIHTHNFSPDWKHDNTSHWHECDCGEQSKLAEHNPSEWIVVTPATTDLEGVQIKKCTVCGTELEREAIEKIPNENTGNVVGDVKDTAGTNAELVQDNTLIEKVLTPEDNAAVENGSSFKIVLEVTDIRDSDSPTDVAAASSALKADEKIGIYVNLSLFKIKDNSAKTPIYSTNGRIGITLTIPESIYASDRTYSIIRVHDGVAENLGGTYDKTSRRLTFYTDKFSTYAIAYTASNGGTDRPSVPSTPPTGGTTPVSPSVPVVTPTVTETTVKKEEEVISDEPYVEDVSSAAGIYESGETDNNIHYVMILIFATVAGIATIAAKKYFCKKNMK